MKKLTYVVLSLILLISCNEITKRNSQSDAQIFTKNIASVEFSEAIATKENFFFSTVGGKMFMMMDSKAAQELNNMLLSEKNATLNELGLANAFAVSHNGKIMLCTARHASEGLESFCSNIGNDIVMIDYSRLDAVTPKLIDNASLYSGYSEGMAGVNDSIFIKGHYSDSKGIVKNVTVKGIGTSSDELMKQDYSGSQNLEFLEKNSLIMRLERNIDLGGLSGAPAFNKQGKVVGVYSGRSLMVSGSDTTCYIRVSLL